MWSREDFLLFPPDRKRGFLQLLRREYPLNVSECQGPFGDPHFCGILGVSLRRAATLIEARLAFSFFETLGLWLGGIEEEGKRKVGRQCVRGYISVEEIGME